MARIKIIGGETGDLSELSVAPAGVAIDGTIFNDAGGKGGAYAFKSTGTTIGQFCSGLNVSHGRFKFYFYFDTDTAPTGSDVIYNVMFMQDAGGVNTLFGLRIYHLLADGFFYLEARDIAGAIVGVTRTRITIAKNTWYRFDVDLTKGAGTGAVTVYQDGVSILSASSQQFGANNIDIWDAWSNQNMTGRAFWMDDCEVDDAAVIGESYVLARSPTAGAPTYDSWTKSTGPDAYAVLDETPFSATDNITSSTSLQAQTALIGTFASTQSGHGNGIIHSYDTINGYKTAMVAKTASTAAARTQGALIGTLTGAANSITNPIAATGSVSVQLNDLIYAVFAEQTSLTVGTVTDNLGNTYTPTNAGTDGGTATGRAYWALVTVAGTLTSVSAAATASGDNVAAVAGAFVGPFTSSPLDANPANNNNSDNSSPFTCPATGTLAQANELVVCWMSEDTNNTLSATSPNLKAVQQTSQTVQAVVLGYQTVSATTSVAPAFTGTNPTTSVQGTTSFKFDTNTNGTEAGSAMKSRRRVGGSDTDTSLTLTTSDAYYESAVLTGISYSNLNSIELGPVHGDHPQTQTVEAEWVMASYTPGVAPPSGHLFRANPMNGLGAGGPFFSDPLSL